jgi:hypothetical protein
MANHGYIPRNGIATLAQTIKGAAQLFNMGADLTAFLAGGSVLLAGDIPSMTYSIGGADARTNSLGVLGGALGTETGLSGHLRFVVFIFRMLRLDADSARSASRRATRRAPAATFTSATVTTTTSTPRSSLIFSRTRRTRARASTTSLRSPRTSRISTFSRATTTRTSTSFLSRPVSRLCLGTDLT